MDQDIVFIKLHAPDDFMHLYAGLFDIDLACVTFEKQLYVNVPSEYLSTPLTRPNPNDPIYSRATYYEIVKDHEIVCFMKLFLGNP